MSPPYRIEPLATRKHNRDGFRSGVTALDEYIKKQASQDLRGRVAAVFVLTERGESRVAGFYTLSATQIPLKDIAPGKRKKLPRYPNVPATLLGRLAVDENLKGEGIGSLLLIDALLRAYQASRDVASYAVVVDAKNELAAAFYARNGFVPFKDNRLKLILPMETIAKLFGS